jgi:hypothetical protein
MLNKLSAVRSRTSASPHQGTKSISSTAIEDKPKDPWISKPKSSKPFLLRSLDFEHEKAMTASVFDMVLASP